jgi:hypothetical protein
MKLKPMRMLREIGRFFDIFRVTSQSEIEFRQSNARLQKSIWRVYIEKESTEMGSNFSEFGYFLISHICLLN